MLPVFIYEGLFLAERLSIADPTERANIDEVVDGLVRKKLRRKYSVVVGYCDLFAFFVRIGCPLSDAFGKASMYDTPDCFSIVPSLLYLIMPMLGKIFFSLSSASSSKYENVIDSISSDMIKGCAQDCNCEKLVCGKSSIMNRGEEVTSSPIDPILGDF